MVFSESAVWLRLTEGLSSAEPQNAVRSGTRRGEPPAPLDSFSRSIILNSRWTKLTAGVVVLLIATGFVVWQFGEPGRLRHPGS